MARHHDVAGALTPQSPDHINRFLADGGVVGHVGRARHELGAVLRRVASEDYVTLRRTQQKDETAWRVSGRKMSGDAGEHLFAFLRRVQRTPGVKLAHVKLWHRRLAPRLVERPRPFPAAADNARVREQDPVYRAVAMRVGEKEVG